MKKQTIALAFWGLAALAFAGCEKEKQEALPSPEAITVNELDEGNNIWVVQGGTYQLKVSATPAELETSFTYKVNNPEVATVNNTGLVTGVQYGATPLTITATANGKFVEKEILVQVYLLVDTITVSKENILILSGKSLNIAEYFTVLPSTARTKNLSFASSDTAKVSVTAAGVITAKAVGTATITATTTDGSDKSGSIEVEVTDNPFSEILAQVKGDNAWKLYSTTARAGANYSVDNIFSSDPTKYFHGLGNWEDSDAENPVNRDKMWILIDLNTLTDVAKVDFSRVVKTSYGMTTYTTKTVEVYVSSSESAITSGDDLSLFTKKATHAFSTTDKTDVDTELFINEDQSNANIRYILLNFPDCWYNRRYDDEDKVFYLDPSRPEVSAYKVKLHRAN
jgi:hypothetical protein